MDANQVVRDLAQLLVQTHNVFVLSVDYEQTEVDHVYFDSSLESVLIHDDGGFEGESEVVVVYAHITVVLLIGVTSIDFPLQILADLRGFVLQRLNFGERQNMLLDGFVHGSTTALEIQFLIIVVVGFVENIHFHCLVQCVLINELHHVFKLQGLLLGEELKLNQICLDG